jgi:glycosyltransferase involved in cell wall biosynthesis
MTPTLTAIVPATDAPATLDRCLAAIRSAAAPPEQLLPVRSASRSGPAAARNAAAAEATGDVLVFVDSDVLVHPDAFDRIRFAFASDPGLTALFGSYDDSPEAPGVVSGFRNLLHHHVHQRGAGPAETFWAGLGAVRSDAFHASGGFDADRYPEASIEDVDLGMRLVARGGRITLDPRLRCTHLKVWSLPRMLHTDLNRRGAPWVALLLRERRAPATLNLGWQHRASTVAALVALAGAAARRPTLAFSGVGALVVLNLGFYTLLTRRRGVLHALAGVPLHAAHHLTAAASLPLGIAQHVRERRQGRPPRDA